MVAKLSALLARFSGASPSKATWATVAAFFFFLLLAFYYAQNFIGAPQPADPSWDDEKEMNVLSELLKQAKMPDDKLVIFTMVNAAWAEPGSLLDIFLESFKMLNNSQEDLRKHLIVLAFDQKAYNRCLEMHPFCYSVTTEGIDFSGAKAYMSHDYVKMMWRRTEFLYTVLGMGYSFIFSDADIMWLRNPFPHLLPDKDFQIACDTYYGDPSSHQNRPNGGYLFAWSNERTIKFYKFWYDSRLTWPTKNEQDVYIEIRHNKTLEEIGVKIGYLDTTYFVSFCSHWKYDMSVSATIHANCCNGLQNKIRNLKTLLSDWKEFNSNKTQKVKAWKGPDKCSFAPI